jgi:hypothetical protein
VSFGLTSYFPYTVTRRKKLDPTRIAKFRRLTSEDLAAVQVIARTGCHPYNFGTAPAAEHTSLEEFIQSWEEEFPYAQADVLDKWAVPTLNAEAFDHYIDRQKLTIPGSFSATTIAKLIVYCLLIMEAEHQALQEAWLKALRYVRPDAQDVVDSLAARAQRADPKRTGYEVDHSVQFADAVRNPVIQAAVNNAAVNRWGLSPKNQKRIAKAQAAKGGKAPSSA